MKVTLDLPIGPTEVDLPELTKTFPDGCVGWYQRRQDDCLRAAVATCTQTPYEDVPDWTTKPGTHADELCGWVALSEWAVSIGRRLEFHNGLPPDADSYVTVSPDLGNRYRHVNCVLGDQLFEPGSGLRLPAFLKLQPTTKVEFSLTFERRDP